MARIFPSNALDGWPASRPAMPHGQVAELETLVFLRDSLPAHFVVFHSVHWNLRLGKSLHARETDFIVVNSNGRCLLIEQKMGPLVERGGELYKEYYGGNVKDVATQIHDSRDGIRGQFKKQNKGHDIRLDYLLYCPNHHIQSLNASAIERDNIVDGSRRSQLAKTITDRLGGAADQANDLGKQAIRFFKQTMTMSPDVSSMQARHENRFVELSGQALEIVESIEMTPLRLKINGTAGCGKTQMAMRFLERALEAGKKPLFVCYNHSLKDHIATLMDERIFMKTMHGLIHEFCSRDDVDIDYKPGNKSNEEWRALIDEVVLNTNDEHEEFDFLIVDEGQDLGIDGFEFINLFIKDDADIVWLEDLDQNLGQSFGKPFLRDDFVSISLTRNYRSPVSVFQLIDRVFPERTTLGNSLPGLGYGLHGYKKAEDQISMVEAIIKKHTASGAKPQDIAIVSLKGMGSSSFKDIEELGKHTIRRFNGQYAEGEQVYTQGDITFETIRRFKGQQAPFVILVDVEPDIDRSWSMNALFCGMTRATMHLDVVGNEKNDFNKENFKL
ncbi:MAG: AAA family ATPase [Hyphomicrobiales bacterium]